MNDSIDNQIPSDALLVGGGDGGFYSPIGFHKRGSYYYQESTYGPFVFAASMVVAAITICALPWNPRVPIIGGANVRLIIAAGVLWSGLCGNLAFYFRNGRGQVVTIDPQAGQITIQRPDSEVLISMSNVLAIQLCAGRHSRYQCNLVYEDADSSLKRQCLLNHNAKRHCVSIAKKYSEICDARWIDSSVPESGSERT
jgi:hypothetical protein